MGPFIKEHSYILYICVQGEPAADVDYRDTGVHLPRPQHVPRVTSVYTYIILESSALWSQMQPPPLLVGNVGIKRVLSSLLTLLLSIYLAIFSLLS